jgi:pimeloyl-ACP methyl ester carboxylesterase
MPFCDLGDVRLFYTDEGEGPPVVLVHGWTCDSHDWNYQIPALVSRHRVIALDLRGHGHSSAPPGGYTPRQFAADIARLLRGLDTGPVVAVGHSLGGAVVVEHPELVRAIAPVDAAYGIDPSALGDLEPLVAALRSPQGHAVARQFFSDSFYPPGFPPHLKAHHARRIESLPSHVLSGAFEGLVLAPDEFSTLPRSAAYLGRVRCPALSFRAGRQDPAAVAAWERSCFSHPYSKAVGWDDAGHFLHQEKPEDFNRILFDWIAGLPA